VKAFDLSERSDALIPGSLRVFERTRGTLFQTPTGTLQLRFSIDRHWQPGPLWSRRFPYGLRQ
jgi:hypothetical protein